MTTTTVYYASNNEKQPNRFQLVIGKKNHSLKNKQNVLLKATVVYMFPNKRRR